MLFVLVAMMGLLFSWIANTYPLVQERSTFLPRFNDHEYSLRLVILYPRENVQIPWARRVLGDFALETLMYEPEKDKDGSQLRHARRLYPEVKIFGWPGATNLPAGIKAIEADRHITI